MSTRPDLADNGNSLTDWVETATTENRTSKDVNETHRQFLASAHWAQMLEDELMPWVEAAGDLGDHVLEIGPGPGLTTDLLRRRAERVTAVEIDPTLGEPLRDRLFIAGEAANPDEMGTVDAALQSGARAAERMLATLHR